jgi:hypothetical protein
MRIRQTVATLATLALGATAPIVAGQAATAAGIAVEKSATVTTAATDDVRTDVTHDT